MNLMRMRAFVLASLVAGCSFTQPAVVKQTYLLDAAPPAAAATGTTKPVALKLGVFNVAPQFAGKALVYRTGESRYEADFYNEFFVAPRAMLMDRTADWLKRSGAFATVLDAQTPLGADYVLEGFAPALYGDFRDAAAPAAVLSLQVYLARVDGARRTIVFQREYAQRVAIGARTPDALVTGLNTALQRILSDLERDLRGVAL